MEPFLLKDHHSLLNDNFSPFFCYVWMYTRLFVRVCTPYPISFTVGVKANRPIEIGANKPPYMSGQTRLVFIWLRACKIHNMNRWGSLTRYVDSYWTLFSPLGLFVSIFISIILFERGSLCHQMWQGFWLKRPSHPPLFYRRQTPPIVLALMPIMTSIWSRKIQENLIFCTFFLVSLA